MIRPLFLDDLRAEFERVKSNKSQLKQFHQKLAGLRFLDPACGCGNFLVIAYRELRLLEMDVLRRSTAGSSNLDIQNLSLVDVDAFYGIEISEWPARIAEVAMWLMDHQMNVRFSEAFGQYFVRLPLRKSPENRARQRPAAGLEGDPAARTMQLRARQSAVRGRKISNAEQRADMARRGGRRQEQRLVGLRHRLVFQGGGIHSRKRQSRLASCPPIRSPRANRSACFGATSSSGLASRSTLPIDLSPGKARPREKPHVHVVIVGFAAGNGVAETHLRMRRRHDPGHERQEYQPVLG